MARDRRSIGDLADEVLAGADRQVVKTAGVAYHGNAMATDLGKNVQKVASLLREDAGRSGITYADLARFRRTYGV